MCFSSACAQAPTQGAFRDEDVTVSEWKAVSLSLGKRKADLGITHQTQAARHSLFAALVSFFASDS